jgi:hypothetical protein|tara:strand:- start:756 stop:1637 length:882 start_codon:yes stop_codon:yes gene_type:complete
MGMFDFMFGGGTPEMKPTSATEIPAYLQAAGANLVGAAQDVAQEEYIPYTDPMLAAMTPEQLAAQQQGLGMAGVSTGQMAPAMAAMQAATGGPTAAQITGYMSPYMTGVADIAAQKMQDQSLMQKQQIAASAAGAGGLDSTRYAIQEAERQKNLTSGIGDLYAKAQAEAYAQAGDMAQFAQTQGLQGAIGQGALAAQQQQLGMADVQQQLGIGQLTQGANQQALDLAYQQFQQEGQHPKEQLNWLAGIMNLDPNQATTTQSTMVSQPSAFQNMLGLGAGAANIAGTLGWKPFG